MKKLAAIALALTVFTSSIYAAEGEMGCFGGISTGIKMETLTALAQSKKPTTSKYTLPYKENIYLSGEAETVEGTIEIKPGKGIDKEAGEGTYTETYKMSAQNSSGTCKVTRNVTFSTQYIYDASLKQTTKNTTIKKWSEIITVNGKTYTLDDDLSDFSKSVLEDYTPGVLYYSGDVHYNAVYKSAGSNGSNVSVTVNAPIYGFDQAYAKCETQRRTITVDLGNGEGYAIEETPTFNVYRDIEYAANEPTAISMAGNYKEIVRSEGALSYNILQGSLNLFDEDAAGMIGVSNSPTVEQLSYPTTLNLAGHPAETQIKKMYSMKIFSQDPSRLSTKAVVTKKEYVTMLVKALQIELPEEKTSKSSSKNKNQNTTVNPFTDLAATDVNYKYAVAAYNAGLVDGGKFDGNSYLTREMMYVLNMRAIGLQRLGLATSDVYTAFVDDNLIGNWAKASIYAAAKLGIVTSTSGYVYPKKTVTYAECATFLDQLIDYLRYDLQKDYIDKMLL